MIGVAIRDIVDTKGFRAGLEIGIILTGLGAAIALEYERARHRVASFGGLLLGVGFAIGLRSSSRLPGNLLWAFVLLAGAGYVSELLVAERPVFALAGAALAAPGALVLTAHTGVPQTHWIVVLVVVTVVVGGTLVADFDEHAGGSGWPMALFAVSAVGVYFTVPDTERALVLLGVSAPLVLLGWPVPLASLGRPGSYVAVGALAWVAAADGAGRHTAIIGAVACLTTLVAEPVARLVRGGRDTVLARIPARSSPAVALVAAHLAIVYIASRVAGLQDLIGDAVVVVAFDLIVAVVGLALLEAPTGALPDRDD